MVEKSFEREIELVNLICDGLRLDPSNPDNPAHLYNTGSGGFIRRTVSTWKEVILNLINLFDFDQNPEQLTKFNNLSLSKKLKISKMISITCVCGFRLKTVVSSLKKEYPDFVLEVNDYLNKLKHIESNINEKMEF